MFSLRAVAAGLSVSFAVACTAAPGGDGDGGAHGGSSGGGDVPTTCAQADHGTGCCTPAGVLYYCTTQVTVYEKTCAAGTVCGWNGTGSYYDCVAPPGGADPSNAYPLLCDTMASSSSSSSGASSSSSSSAGASGSSGSTSSSGGTVTWTTLYDTIFGPNGTANCAECHGTNPSTNQSGFICGTTSTACYSGMVDDGLITPGASASSSPLVTKGQSPLCGTLGGNMPLMGPCVTAAQITAIQAWLATGAPDD
jgi:hypothetical protein